jgi:hypothetical protein
MFGKITAALAVAIVLSTTSFASPARRCLCGSVLEER